jgi:hypothetical protein
MTIVRTSLHTVESARRHRYEPGGNVAATNVQDAIEELDAEKFTPTAQSANTVYAGPSSGAAALPTFRVIVKADLPNILTTEPAQSTSLTLTSSVTAAAIDTSGGAVSCTLPLASDWKAANPFEKFLAIGDRTGQAGTNNITPVLAGSDTFRSGVTPKVNGAFGWIRLAPVRALTGWDVLN